MSSDADAAATIALFDTLYTAGYCVMAASVLFLYDAFLTFDREVACFWTSRRTGASFVFFANKYISMTLYVMGLVNFASFSSDKSCSSYTVAAQAMVILQFVPGAAFTALRGYVLSRSKFLGILVFALSLVPVAANLVPYGYQVSGENIPPFGCLETVNVTAVLDIRLVVISRVPLIIADILLIYITWTKLRNWGALRNIRQSDGLSLSDVIFRGGNIYFIVLSVLNVLHLVLTVTAVADDVTTSASLIPTFTAPITAILISRFLLDLQEVNQMVVRLDPDDGMHPTRNPYDTSPSFISSLGGFINPNLSERSDADDAFELQLGWRSAGEDEGGAQTA